MADLKAARNPWYKRLWYWLHGKPLPQLPMASTNEVELTEQDRLLLKALARERFVALKEGNYQAYANADKLIRDITMHKIIRYYPLNT